MKIVQTLWSCQKNLLEHSFGWLSPQHHLMAWALSCLRLKEYYDDIHFYTDSTAYKILLERLDLPYKDVHIAYDHLSEDYGNYYALPKILTYFSQEEPFIHVDGDVFIWQRFNSSLESSALIAQNLEKGTTYYKNTMNHLNPELVYVPDLLKNELSKSSISAYNAGIIGGNDVQFLNEYAYIALDIIEKNSPLSPTRRLPLSFNILFEQILFYALTIKKNKPVACVINEVIEDFGYSKHKFADFSLIPWQATYLHVIGAKKMDPEICALMGRTFMQEYPKHFEKILELFPRKHKYFDSIIASFCQKFNKKTEIFSSNEQYECSSFNKTLSLLKLETNELIKIPFHQLDLSISDKKSKMVGQVFRYESEFSEVKKKWDEIDFEYLMFLQFEPLNVFETLIKSKELQTNSCFKRNPFLYVVEDSFNWDIETKNYVNPNLVQTDLNEILGLVYIPQIFFDGYCEVIIDELDYNLLAILERPKSLVEILDQLEKCFANTTEENTYDAMYQLTLLRLKRLFLTQCILIYPESKSVE
jgi:hypothetical protein